MTASPPVSVLLPVRDGAAHLDEAIHSIERQSFTDFEVLAVDDGSVDDTYEKLSAWASRDASVTVIRRAPGGIVAALEAARGVARGTYLARMDADPPETSRSRPHRTAGPGLRPGSQCPSPARRRRSRRL